MQKHYCFSMKIFIVGYMGSGKTQTGYYISKKLEYNYIDTDAFIEKKYGEKILQIFKTKGEDFFRKIEAESLRYISSNNQNIVISTGGGTPCFYNNMKYMNQKGITVYTKMSSKLLASRLYFNKEKRPLISNINSIEELEKFIQNHKKIRERECYSYAQIIADMESISLDQLFSIIKYTIWTKKK